MYRKIIPTVLAMLLALVIVPGGALAGKTAKDNSEPSRCTVILLIDGLQQSHLKSAKTPNIKGLINSGTTAGKVTGVPDTVAGAVSVLLTGNANASGEAVTKFFSNQSDQGLKTVFIDGTGGQLGSLARGADVAPSTGAQNAINMALREIDSAEDIYCVIVLPRANPQNLSTTDNQIGFLLNHLRKLGILNQSLIALTGTTQDPPVILNGPRVRGGIKVPIASFEDVAATVCFLNNQKLPGKGMVLYEVIESDGVHSQDYLLQQRIKDLSESYARVTGEIEQIRQEQKEVKRQQSKLDEEKAKYTAVIEKQQKEIDHLKLKITLFKLAGWLVILLFIISLYIEYRFLKKRFMFFT